MDPSTPTESPPATKAGNRVLDQRPDFGDPLPSRLTPRGRAALAAALALLSAACASHPQSASPYVPYEERARQENQRRLALARENHSPAAPELVRTAPLPDFLP